MGRDADQRAPPKGNITLELNAFEPCFQTPQPGAAAPRLVDRPSKPSGYAVGHAPDHSKKPIDRPAFFSLHSGSHVVARNFVRASELSKANRFCSECSPANSQQQQCALLLESRSRR